MLAPITILKRWERQSRKLPNPDTAGAWIVSPDGTYFITQLRFDGSKWHIGWEPCNADLVPFGIAFRQEEIVY